MIEYREDLFGILPLHIVWCYKEWQSAYSVLQEREGSNIKFIHGIPDDEDEIVSDTSAPTKTKKKIKLWFTRKGHHRNATVVYITQNFPWVLNFPPCRGPGGSIPTGNVASLVSSN